MVEAPISRENPKTHLSECIAVALALKVVVILDGTFGQLDARGFEERDGVHLGGWDTPPMPKLE